MNCLAFLSNLAGPDGFIILFFVLIFFGAKRLPELARSMGTAVKEFHKAKEEFTSQLTNAGTEPVAAFPRKEVLPMVPTPPAAPAQTSESDKPSTTSTAV